MSEERQALSVGAVIGGSTPGNQAWRNAIRRVTKAIASAAKGVDVPLGLNVVFHVPGNLAAPDFEGLRTGRYSKAMSLLMVQIAVPATLDSDPDRFIHSSVAAAILEASRWAEKKRIPIDVHQLQSILAESNKRERQ
jgi:hypothetical protein